MSLHSSSSPVPIIQQLLFPLTFQALIISMFIDWYEHFHLVCVCLCLEAISARMY